MSNIVKKKIMYSIVVNLASPLCVSCGDGTLTDRDVITDGKGIPFVPGASLAGAMRSYLEKEKIEDCIFGYENMESNTGRMSMVYVSDLFFDGNCVRAIRDGVALTENKTAVTGAKFDMEVIDTGAKGHFWIELVIRENDNEKEALAQLEKALMGWNVQEIRIGSKKSRGYGKLQLVCVKRKVFDENNILEYKDAYCPIEEQGDSWITIPLPQKKDTQYVSIRVPLILQGGISIRQYAAKKNEPDFVHITANGKPVIPGTSFAGAIRHRMKQILVDLGAVNVNEVLDFVFGYVKEEGADSKACKSNIIVNECELEGATKMLMVRNGISRFEAGARDGALFKEISYVGGQTSLEILVKKMEQTAEIIGLLLLVLKDVQNGFLAVGGQTSVGRGVFMSGGEIEIDSGMTGEEYLKAAVLAIRRV